MSIRRGHIRQSQAACFVAVLILMPHAARGQWDCTGGTCSTTGNVGIGTTTPTTQLQISGRNNALGVGGQLSAGESTGLQFLDWGTQHAALRWTNDGTHNVVLEDASATHNPSSWYANIPVNFIVRNGSVGIGTLTPQHKLAVNGTIGAKEVVVTNTGWADYVFKPGYVLTELDELAAHIRERGRLPHMPSEEEVKAEGISLGDMEVKLLVKIEELTLHLIQEHERGDRLEQQNRDLQERIARVERRVAPGRL